ncbi:MAG: DUF4350 domain-containing protein [Saprospirales bacterium]|nr:DUF4350 domain-containing protein [Saprospirales bacterium]
MEKNRIWLWGGFLVLVLAVLLFLFWPGDKRTNWTESYRHDSNQPYGTQLIHALLKDQAGEDRFFIVEDSLIGNLTKWEGSPANYVFIGPGILLDSLEEDYLLAFAEQGNTLFLALNGLPVGLLSRLLSTDLDSLELDRYSYRMDSTVSATLTYDQWQDTRLQLTCYDQTGALEYNWAYWNLALLAGLEEDSITAETLGILDAESINFIRIPYGRGVILFHSTPLAFTNFYVKESDGLDYADKVMAYLNDGPIYWDHYSDYESAFRRTWGRRPPRTTRSISGEGPLQYILSQPPWHGPGMSGYPLRFCTCCSGPSAGSGLFRYWNPTPTRQWNLLPRSASFTSSKTAIENWPYKSGSCFWALCAIATTCLPVNWTNPL